MKETLIDGCSISDEKSVSINKKYVAMENINKEVLTQHESNINLESLNFVKITKTFRDSPTFLHWQSKRNFLIRTS